MNKPASLRWSPLHLKLLLTLVLYLAMAAGLYHYLGELDWQKLRTLSLDLPIFAGAVLFGATSRLLLPWCWLLVLSRLAANRIPFAHAARAYAQSWLCRYLPGKAIMLLARVAVASRYGISTSVVGVSSFLELVVQTAVSLAAGVAGILTLREAFPLVAEHAKILTIVLLVLCTLASPPVLGRLLAVYNRRRGLTASVTKVEPGIVVKMVALYFFYSLIFALYSAWMMAAIVDGVFIHWWFLWGALNFARIAGMATMIAPAGLGVREAVLMVLLTLVFPKEAVLSATVVMRLGDILVDLLFVLLAYLLPLPPQCPSRHSKKP